MRRSEGDQDAEQIVQEVGVAQVPGSVQRVEPSDHQGGRVADVVQPGGGDRQAGVTAKDGRQGPGGGRDTLGVRPATGERFFKQTAR